MSRAPLFRPRLDLIPPQALVDERPARASYLREIDRRQHALMTGWGGPTVSRSFYVSTSGITAPTFTLRIPPGVTECDIGLLMFGIGEVTITTTGIDAVGTTLRNRGQTDEAQATWQRTGGVWTSGSAATGRAVTVASSASWAWADVDFVFTTAAVTTAFGWHCVELAPIHVPR